MLVEKNQEFGKSHQIPLVCGYKELNTAKKKNPWLPAETLRSLNRTKVQKAGSLITSYLITAGGVRNV